MAETRAVVLAYAVLMLIRFMTISLVFTNQATLDFRTSYAPLMTCIEEHRVKIRSDTLDEQDE
jgi:hypothetical protein